MMRQDRIRAIWAGPWRRAMLGITRQGVHDLVSRGKLTRHPEGGVVPASIRDRLRTDGGKREGLANHA